MSDFFEKNPKAVDIRGEKFGSLIAQTPVGVGRQGVIWRCSCTKCGTGSRDLSLGRLRQAVRVAQQAGRECYLACEACARTKRGVPASKYPVRPLSDATKRPAPKRVAPLVGVHLSRRKREKPGPPKPEPGVESAAETQAQPPGDFELVVDGLVVARGCKGQDFSALQAVMGGTIRPVPRGR